MLFLWLLTDNSVMFLSLGALRHYIFLNAWVLESNNTISRYSWTLTKLICAMQQEYIQYTPIQYTIYIYGSKSVLSDVDALDIEAHERLTMSILPKVTHFINFSLSSGATVQHPAHRSNQSH